MIARRKVIEEMAESVKTCLSDVQPNLGVVARQNTVRGRSGSISYQVRGMFDSGCQRFEDVIVDPERRIWPTSRFGDGAAG